MALKTIMLLLTLAGDGEAHVNFSEAEDMAACEAKITAVKQVLAGAGIELIDARCGQSDLKVSKYQRGAPKDAPRFPYKVTLKDGGFTAEAVAEGACAAEETGGVRVICATSTQRPL